MKFAKPALTFDQQVLLLISRGMVVADPPRAAHYLAHINYYRFAGYVLPFEVDHVTHQVRPGTRFDDVLNVYVFDRELRLLVLDAIERIEVSVRTQWAYHLAHHISPHGYLEHSHSASVKQLARQLALMAAVMDDSKEPFVAHHRSKYTDPDLPPIWVACELLSLGQLSQWYTMLRPMGLRKKIAKSYLLDQQVLQSVLQHLTYVRNTCAHHGRLWNREFVITCSTPRKGVPRLTRALDDPESRRLYKTLCLIVHFMDCINPGHSWRQRLLDLINTHGINIDAMGFPMDWKSRDIWAIAP